MIAASRPSSAGRIASGLATAACAVLAAVVSPTAGATGVGVQPANVEMVVAPGSKARKVIKVGNLRTDRPQKFVVGLAEWDLDAEGRLKLLPPRADSSTAWVRFTPAEFTLGPGEGMNVLVEVEVPARLPESRENRFALLVTNPPPSPAALKGRTGVLNQFQVASLFYLTLQGQAPVPVVESVEWIASDPAAAAIRAKVSNRGTAHARFIATVEILDREGKLAHQAESTAVVMAGQSRDWVNRLKVPDLPPGRYEVAWQVYSAFDPKRPDQRAGELIESKEWTWERSAPSPKPSPR